MHARICVDTIFSPFIQALAKYPELNGDDFIERVIDGDADVVGEMILAGIDTNVKRSKVSKGLNKPSRRPSSLVYIKHFKHYAYSYISVRP
jgi:hypothetical protein